MTYADFMNSETLQRAAEAFISALGGRFMGEEPGDRLMYEMESGETAYTPPDGATMESVLKQLQSGKPLSGLWPELEYEPGIDY